MSASVVDARVYSMRHPRTGEWWWVLGALTVEPSPLDPHEGGHAEAVPLCPLTFDECEAVGLDGTHRT